MGPIHAPHFFQAFETQVNQSESWLLVSKNGTVFLEKKEGLSIVRLFKRMQGSCYDLHYNASLFLQTSFSLDELQDQIRICSFIQKLLKHAYTKRQNSPLKLLSREYKNRCIQLIQQYSTTSLHSQLQVACEHEMYWQAISLLEKGANIDDAKDHLNALLQYAHQKSKTELCFTLIVNGALPNSPETASHYLHKAANQGRLDVATALLKAGVAVNAKDHTGSTPLHTACSALHFEMAMLLVRYGGDVSALNHDKVAPFQLPLQCQTSSKNNFYALLFPKTSTRIDDLIKEATNTPASFISHHKNLCALEFAYLLHDADMAQKLVPQYSEETFLAALNRIASKFPNSSLDFLYFSQFKIQKEHLQRKLPETEITVPNAAVDLNDLVSLVDSFDHHKLDSKNFISKRKVKKKLQKFVDRITNQTEFIGTPKKGSRAIQDFYRTIEYALKNILLHLKTAAPPEEHEAVKIELINELRSIFSFCGGRYFTGVVMLHHKICQKTPFSFEDKLLLAIAEYRLSLVLSIINPANTHNVNEYNGFIRLKGESLGIPAAKAMNCYTDPNGYGNLEKNEKLFFELYTPCNIQMWVAGILNDDGALREEYIDWHKAELPDTTSDDDIHTYLSTKVFEENGSLKPAAISHLLCTFNILSSQLAKTCA